MGIYPFAVVVLCGTYTFGGWVSGRMETRPEKQHSEQMGIPSVTANFPTLFFTIFVLHFALHCTTKSPPFFGYFGNAISYYQNNSDPPDYRVLQWFLHSSIGQTRYFKYSKKKKYFKFFFFPEPYLRISERSLRIFLEFSIKNSKLWLRKSHSRKSNSTLSHSK